MVGSIPNNDEGDSVVPDISGDDYLKVLVCSANGKILMYMTQKMYTIML